MIQTARQRDGQIKSLKKKIIQRLLSLRAVYAVRTLGGRSICSTLANSARQEPTETCTHRLKRGHAESTGLSCLVSPAKVTAFYKPSRMRRRERHSLAKGPLECVSGAIALEDMELARRESFRETGAAGASRNSRR